MTDTTTLDAAILKGMMAVGGYPTNDEQRRTYARALIAKLLEGMEIAELSHLHAGYAEISHWRTGYNAALTKIRRRAGLLEDKA
jgi:hypothetical protein